MLVVLQIYLLVCTKCPANVPQNRKHFLVLFPSVIPFFSECTIGVLEWAQNILCQVFGAMLEACTGCLSSPVIMAQNDMCNHRPAFSVTN